ncbi:MAG: alpha/beta fold hydrolase, partial [Halobacteriaceae archaeon]
ETVVFIEDIGCGNWLWSWQYEGLPGKYQLVTWDLRGTGKSDRPNGPYTIDDFVFDLEAVLKAADIPRTHLVGVGLGGLIALEYSYQFSRARTLTLIGTAMQLTANESIHEQIIDTDPNTSITPFLNKEKLSEEVLSAIQEWRKQDDAPPARKQDQLHAVRQYTIPDYLPEITEPTLLIHGENDRIFPLQQGRELAQNLPHSDFYPISDGSHLVNIECSVEVNDTLVRILENHTL